MNLTNPSEIANTNNPNFDFSLVDKPEENPNIGLFNVKTANQFINEAKSRPKPSKLFGQLWWEHEICILFADSNVGKSILAVQIADGISQGRNVIGLDVETESQVVLYCDFELSDKQFELRYINDNGKHYNFSDKLLRLEINPDI